MDAIVAHQFLPARKPAVIRRLLAQLPARHVVAMLDLEDSAADVLAPERTSALKAAARAILAAFFAAGGVPADRPLGVRVNAAGTPDHAADLATIAEAVQRGHDVAVLLPKVESAAAVENAARFFDHRGLKPPRFYLLAETGPGVEQLRAILAQTQPLIAGVVLGMIDYALDQGMWPFPGPFDPTLWAIASRVADACGDAGVTYVHTPCLRLRDRPLIQEVCRRLREMRGGPTGMVTLSLEQMRAIVEPAGGNTAGGEGDASLADPVAEARYVIQEFREHRSGKRSFTVDAVHDRFIPPQEYLAAVRVLAARGDNA
jgi:citrate lyase beta subunit